MGLVEIRTITGSNRLFFFSLWSWRLCSRQFLFWVVLALSSGLQVEYFARAGFRRVGTFEYNLRLLLWFISRGTGPGLDLTRSNLVIPKLGICAGNWGIGWLGSFSRLYLSSNYKGAVTSWTTFVVSGLMCFCLRLVTQRSPVRDQLTGHLWVTAVLWGGLVWCNPSSKIVRHEYLLRLRLGRARHCLVHRWCVVSAKSLGEAELLLLQKGLNGRTRVV
jgi:hypothetical protein